MKHLVCLNEVCVNYEEVKADTLRTSEEISCEKCGLPMEEVDYRALETEPFRSRGVYA